MTAFTERTQPTLPGYTTANPARGVPRPSFLDSESKPHTFLVACESLTVTLPDGDALLTSTELHGMMEPCPVPGLPVAFQVVAVPLQVRATFAGEGQ